jgi:hypothetical protein
MGDDIIPIFIIEIFMIATTEIKNQKEKEKEKAKAKEKEKAKKNLK